MIDGNISVLDLKNSDSFLMTNKVETSLSNEKDFSNYLKKAMSSTSDKSSKDIPLKNAKSQSVDVEKFVTKSDFLDNVENEEELEKYAALNEELQILILNLLNIIVDIDEDNTLHLENNEDKLNDVNNVLDKLDSILKNENQYLSENDIEVLQNVINKLNEVEEIVFNKEDGFKNVFKEKLITELKDYLTYFKKQSKSLLNDAMFKSDMDDVNKVILKEEDVKSNNDLNKLFTLDEEVDDVSVKTKDVVYNQDKKELTDEKLESESDEIDFTDTINESLLKNAKGKDLFDNDIEMIQKKEIEIPKDEVVKQIVDKGKLILDENKSEIRIKLKPEILGELLLKVEVEKGVVVAKALVDNYKVKELIESNIYQLKEGLEKQGLDIKTFEVQIGGNTDFDKERRDKFYTFEKNKKSRIKKTDVNSLNTYEKINVNNNPILNEGVLDIMA